MEKIVSENRWLPPSPHREEIAVAGRISGIFEQEPKEN